MGLFAHAVPDTVERFQGWCRRGCYEETPFHRIIPGFMAQGGDVTDKNGLGGKIDGVYYKDENFSVLHDEKYVVSCANAGRDTNTTQFFITLKDKLAHLDRKHVVFGRVLDR